LSPVKALVFVTPIILHWPEFHVNDNPIEFGPIDKNNLA
jgi:hypothetical protein